MSDFQNAIAMLKSGIEINTDAFNCGPRVETLMNQSVYMGIWCYSGPGVTVFSLEVREATDPSLFEDGPVLTIGSEIRIFETFESALSNMTEILTALTDKSAV